MQPPAEGWLAVAGAVTMTLAVARVARLLIHDTLPPVEDSRLAFTNLMNRRPYTARWGEIARCPWCLTPWLVAADLWWAAAVTLHPNDTGSLAWWAVNVWLAVSWLAAFAYLRDEPD